MKRLKYLSFMAIVLLALTGCGKEKVEEKKKEEPKEAILLKEDLKLEINSEVTLLSLVSKDNKTEIISKDETIDTSALGEKELVIAYKENDEEKKYKFKVKVVDTEAPEITYKKELSTNVGTKIDLLKGVKVSDNSKEEIKAIVEGEYDINKEGTYSLKYVAVDSSNNKTEEKFTLKVNKKAASVSKPQTSDDNATTNDDSSDDNNIRPKKNQYEYVDMNKTSSYYGRHLWYDITFAWNPIAISDDVDNPKGAMVLYKIQTHNNLEGSANRPEELSALGFTSDGDRNELMNWIKTYAPSIIPKGNYDNEGVTCSNGIKYGTDGATCSIVYTHETEMKSLFIYTGQDF